MPQIFSHFMNPFEGLAKLPWYVWAAVALLAVTSIAFIFTRKMRLLPKIIVSVLATAALGFLLTLLLASFSAPVEDVTSVSLNTLVVIFCVAVLGVLLVTLRKLRLDTRAIVAAALSISVGFILSTLKFYQMPQGGSITPASMLPLMFFAWCYGPIPGIAAGLVYGTLQLLQDFYVVHPLQLLLDYLFAFTALGLAGLFPKSLNLGILVAGLTRLLMHIISGFVFFGSYAPEGQHPLLYSLGYNASVILPDLAICLILANIPALRRSLVRIYKRPATETAGR